MGDSLGDRVFAVRAALGGGVRKPLSQDAFAERLSELGGRTYYGPDISLIERNKKPLTLDDVAAMAALDPDRRGKYWLAWGGEADETRVPLPTPSLDELQTEVDISTDAYAAPRASGKRKGKTG